MSNRRPLLHATPYACYLPLIYLSTTAIGIGVGGHTNAWPHLLAQAMNHYLDDRQSHHRTDTIQSNVSVKSSQSDRASQSNLDPITLASETRASSRLSTGARARFVVANRAKGGTTSVWALTRLNALLTDVDDEWIGTPSQSDGNGGSSRDRHSASNISASSSRDSDMGHDRGVVVGGCGGSSSGIDLVIVDYDITDCFSLVNNNNNNNNNNNADDDTDDIINNGTSTHPHPHSPQSTLLAASELLVRRILAHPSMPAVVFTNVAVPNTGQQVNRSM